MALLVGVGNPMYGDDAAGYCAARALLECGPPGGARIVARQTLTLADAALLWGEDTVVIVDSAPGSPGVEVYDLRVEPPRGLPAMPDSHGVTPLDLVRVAVDAGVFTGKAILVLVRAPGIEFGRGVTPGLEHTIARAAALACRLACGAGAGMECLEAWLERCVGEPLLD